MRTKTTLITTVMFLAMSTIGCAQPGELVVGDISMRGLRWGEHRIPVELTNNTDLVKYVVIETEVTFDGTYLDPVRYSRVNYILDMKESRVVNLHVTIPSNFGKATVTVAVHDVVDTLDVLMPYQKVFEQPFHLTYHVPEALQDYFEEKITLPPRVEDHPQFDSEFPRVMLLLLWEGKSLQQIADMSETDSAYVARVARGFGVERYASANEDSYQLHIPMIVLAEAEEAKKLAESVSDSLAMLIGSNLATLKDSFDSLISLGVAPADSNEFMHGGYVLSRYYPTVGGLLLWHDLGRKFITRSAPLLLYDGTDLCNAHIPTYMYAVQGGDVFNGHHFFYLEPGRKNCRIYFGDQLPLINCNANFIARRRAGRKAVWTPDKAWTAEGFIVDTTLIRPALDILGLNTDSLLSWAYYGMKAIAIKHGHKKVAFGHRYWFWNLVASRTLTKLTDSGVLSRRDNGQFRFDAN